MTKPVFTVIAGINGAGKTSLYRVMRSEIEGEHINTDEIACSLGNPNDVATQVKAGRYAIKQIDACLIEGKSVHIETTLSGTVINKLVTKANESGFKTVMYFVGVDSLDIALDRVHRRMANGGHGISDKYIIKKYVSLGNKLKELLPMFDETYMYDNTVSFRQVAVLRDGNVIDCDSHMPCWLVELAENKNKADG